MSLGTIMITKKKKQKKTNVKLANTICEESQTLSQTNVGGVYVMTTTKVRMKKMCNECDYPLGYDPQKENNKCHWEDGCKYDFFKELTALYDVENMQEFIAKIRAEVIDECIETIDYCLTISECQGVLKELKAGGKE